MIEVQIDMNFQVNMSCRLCLVMECYRGSDPNDPYPIASNALFC